MKVSQDSSGWEATVTTGLHGPPAARVYAIREIARRAGATAEFIRSWQFEAEESWTTVRIGPSPSEKIRFPIAVRQRGHLPELHRRVTRAGWPYEPDRTVSRLIPDFVIPFVAPQEDASAPIFRRRDDGGVDFLFDLPTAALWTLARREEETHPERDAHGRFPARASVAAEFNFLHRPIVDEYGFALEQALRCLVPGWEPCPRVFRVKLSHDIDDAGIPFHARTTVAHTLRRRNPAASARDLVSLLSGKTPAYLSLVEKLVLLSRDYRLNSAIYWKAGPHGPYDPGYDPRHPKIQRVIARLLESGVECGVHPGYNTFDAPEQLRSEVDIVRSALRGLPMGGRQHYLRWKPLTWRHWEECGLAYDSTVGFADRIGFRAGTCIPYRPWIFSENREANLLEIPLLVMDCTPIYYMRVSVDEAFEAILDCVQRCRLVGGVFTLLWHNTSLIDPAYGDLYKRLLEHLSGAEGFDGRIL